MSELPQLILVHGSFHGPWCWDQTRPTLETAGFEVICPALPAISSPDTRRSDHVNALSELLGSAPTILVGHSYAGMLLADAAVREGADVRQCVYFDAFVPQAGESAFELLGDFGQLLREQSADSGLIPPPPPQALGISDQQLAEEVANQLTPMAAATHADPATHSALAQHAWKSAYIRCGQFEGFAGQADRAKEAGWPCRVIDAGHDAMISDPELFAAALLELLV